MPPRSPCSGRKSGRCSQGRYQSSRRCRFPILLQSPTTVKSTSFPVKQEFALARSFPFLVHIELPAKKLRRRPVPSHPILPQQKIMDLIREDELLKFHVLPAQSLHQVGGLSERNIAVIIAMDQQHRRAPLPY